MNDTYRKFSKNLRQRRIELGLSQAKVGELVGYSEKSICKWETGRSLPHLEVAVELSKVLNIDLNELLGCNKESNYYLGIDGGATKTVFALADANGNVLKTLRLSSCNPFDIGMSKAQNILEDGIREICTGISYGNISLFAGISGGVSGGNQKIFHTFFQKFGFAHLQNDNDTENAIYTGLKGGDGINVIMGTGSAISIVKNGTRKYMGGYGYLFDNSLCGYDLGRDAIVASLKQLDGSGKKTVLYDMVTSMAGGTVDEKLNDLYSRGKTYIASFSKLIFEAVKLGDSVANDILENRVLLLCIQLKTALTHFDKNEKVKIALVGGISEHKDELLPYFKKHLLEQFNNVDLCFAENEPIWGALALAGAPLND